MQKIFMPDAQIALGKRRTTDLYSLCRLSRPQTLFLLKWEVPRLLSLGHWSGKKFHRKSHINSQIDEQIAHENIPKGSARGSKAYYKLQITSYRKNNLTLLIQKCLAITLICTVHNV